MDERGVPISIVVTGANRHDVTQLAAVLDGVIIERPDTDQHLCADKGYAGDPAQQTIKDRHYTPHLTLGRLRRTSANSQLQHAIDGLKDWEGGSCPVRELLVIASELSPQGPHYAVMGRGKLA